MNQNLISIGIIILFIGIAIIFIGSLSGADNTNSKVAVGGIIGFIPFGFGNDKRLVIAMIATSAFLLVLFTILARSSFS